MCLLHIHAQNYGKNFEILPDEVEHAELMTEDIVSHVLLELFNEATVDDVAVHFSSASPAGLRICSIHIQAQCSYESFKLYPCSKEYMELVVGKSMCSILRELFGSVTIKSVVVQPSYMQSH